MSDLTMIDRDAARTLHPRAFAYIEQQMHEVANSSDVALIVVEMFLARTGNSVTLRALVADKAEFQKWIDGGMEVPQPFSFFVEAPTALN